MPAGEPVSRLRARPCPSQGWSSKKSMGTYAKLVAWKRTSRFSARSSRLSAYVRSFFSLDHPQAEAGIARNVTPEALFAAIDNYLLLFICRCSQLSFTSCLISLVHSFALIPYALGGGLLLHSTQASLAIHVHSGPRGIVVKLKVGLTFLARMLSVGVEVIFQVVEASKLLVAVLAGKRFLSFVYVQVSFVRGEVVKFFFTSIAFIWTVTYGDKQTTKLLQPSK